MHLEHLIRQKSYEHPVFILRRHPFVFLRWVAIFVLLAALPYIVFRTYTYFYPLAFAGPYARPLFVLGTSVYYLWIWLFFFSQFIDYYLDVWVVTNDRIVNIEQKGLFARTISELDLYKIQDVTSDVKGMIPTFFNYGNVHIQTAGTMTRFVFEQVPGPHDIRKKIVDLIENDRKYHLKDIKVGQVGL